MKLADLKTLEHVELRKGDMLILEVDRKRISLMREGSPILIGNTMEGFTILEKEVTCDRQTIELIGYNIAWLFAQLAGLTVYLSERRGGNNIHIFD